MLISAIVLILAYDSSNFNSNVLIIKIHKIKKF